MKKARNYALVNGVCIGLALGLFLLGWVNHYIAYELAQEYVEKWLPLYPGDEGLLAHIEYLKATGNEIMLICIILGIVILGVGIGLEAYQRAKKEDG
jgi:hypothetical protein